MFASTTSYLYFSAPATVAVVTMVGLSTAAAAVVGFAVLRSRRRRGGAHGTDLPLTAGQVERIRRIHATFAELDAQAFEERLDEFGSNPHPEQELLTWERMAAAYERFVARRELSLPARNEVFKLFLLRSSSDAEVLRRQGLYFLSRQDAIEVLRDV